jgi:hypothetical protein
MKLPPQHITPSLMWSLLQNNAENVRIGLLSLRRGQHVTIVARKAIGLDKVQEEMLVTT